MANAGARERRGRVPHKESRAIRCLAIVAALFVFHTPACFAGKFLPHHAHLTLAGKVAYFKRSVTHERQVVAWLESRHAPRTLQRVSELGWYRRALGWHERLYAAYAAKLTPSDLPAWVCIHGYEGAWNANTGNGYFGGLQENLGFQQTYGPELLAAKGTADHWTPAEQIMVARRARDGYAGHPARGYGPWPNTARFCGLL